MDTSVVSISYLIHFPGKEPLGRGIRLMDIRDNDQLRYDLETMKIAIESDIKAGLDNFVQIG